MSLFPTFKTTYHRRLFHSTAFSAAFALGALSMIGIPPLGGFLSKWYIGIGALEAHQLPIIAVLVGSTILNACYFLPIVYAAFFKEEKHDEHHASGHGHGHSHSKYGLEEAPAIMVIPLVLTAIGALALFVAPSIFLDLARMVVTSVTGGN